MSAEPIVSALVVTATALVLGWLALAVVLAVAYPGRAPVRELLRLLPDVVRLVRALLTDPRVPRGVRAELWLLLAYLALPIDLVPDVVPVLGYADDVVLALLVLRRAVRRTDVAVVRELWPGRTESLDALLQIAVGSAAGGGEAGERPPRADGRR